MLTTMKDQVRRLPRKHQNLILLAVYFCLVFLRAPYLLTHGRLWAEEGSVYLKSAWNSPLWSALIAPHLGYYALYPNLSTLVAVHFFPLAYSALIVTWAALLIQLLMAYLVLDCELFTSLPSRLLALAITLFVSPNREVWLNTINSQFYLVICGVIIFLSDPARKIIFRTAVLVLAGLTGTLTVYLTPMFWIRAFVKRSRGAWIQASALTVCMAMQLGVVLHFLHAGQRQIHFYYLAVGPDLITRELASPILGRKIATHMAFLMLQHAAVFYLLTWGILIATAFFVLRLAVKRKMPSGAHWLMLAALMTACLCMYGALNNTTMLIYPVTSERYSFSCNIMLALGVLLLLNTQRPGRPLRRHFLQGVLACFLLTGLWDYVTYSHWYEVTHQTGPSWRLQVSQWEKDPSAQLQAWPDKGFPFTLPLQQQQIFADAHPAP